MSQRREQRAFAESVYRRPLYATLLRVPLVDKEIGGFIRQKSGVSDGIHLRIGYNK